MKINKEVGIPYLFMKSFTQSMKIDLLEPLPVTECSSDDLEGKLDDETKFSSVVLSEDTYIQFRENVYVQSFYLKLFRELLRYHYLSFYAVPDQEEWIVIAIAEEPTITSNAAPF